MNLEEAKERLNCLYLENADLLSNCFEFEDEAIYIDEELANEYLLENEAIETVLQEIEHLQKENEELKAKQVMQEFKIDWCEKNTISKDKIKEKIEEIKNKPNNPNQKVIATQIDASLIACLQDLLKEE